MDIPLERILFLKGVELFSSLEASDLQWVLSVAEEASFPADKAIFKEGEAGDALYIVLEGNVRILKGSVVLAVLGERECFGEMSLLDEEVRSASAEASGECRLLVISRPDFLRLVEIRPQISFALMKVLGERLRRMQEDLMTLQKEAESLMRASMGKPGADAAKSARQS